MPDWLRHAEHVLDDHIARLHTRKARVHACVDQRLDRLIQPDQARAAERGERLEHVLGDVHRLAQRVEHGGDELLVLLVDVGVDAGGAVAVAGLDDRVGHHAQDLLVVAEQPGQRTERHAARDGHHDTCLLDQGTDRLGNLGHLRGVHRDDDQVGRLQRGGRVLDGGDTVRLRNISTANLQQLVDGDVLCLRDVVVQQTTKDPLAHRAAAAEYDLLVAHE